MLDEYYRVFEIYGMSKEDVSHFLGDKELKLSLLIAEKQGWINEYKND